MVDHDRLAAIVQGSPHEGAEVIAEFRRANAADGSSLHLACATDDFEQITRLAHRIKGSCLMMGATGLAEACSLMALAGRGESSANTRDAMAFYDRESAALDAYLQALPADAPAHKAGTDRPSRLCEGLHFVVAEDHDFQRSLIMMLLNRAGAASVCGVDSGAKALEHIDDAGHRVDILVLDLSMPGMDGQELLRKLAERKSQVAVILNSALSPSQISVVVQQVASCGMRILGVISKPLTAAALQPLVEAFHAASPSRNPAGRGALLT